YTNNQLIAIVHKLRQSIMAYLQTILQFSPNRRGICIFQKITQKWNKAAPAIALSSQFTEQRRGYNDKGKGMLFEVFFTISNNFYSFVLNKFFRLRFIISSIKI